MNLSREARAFDRWLTTEPEPCPEYDPENDCPFGQEDCSDNSKCDACISELAEQDDFDAYQD